MEDGWKVRMNICTALWSFANFCCLSQSEVSTDNRKVSTFFAFQHDRCRCCYRSYLDRFLIIHCQRWSNWSTLPGHLPWTSNGWRLGRRRTYRGKCFFNKCRWVHNRTTSDGHCLLCCGGPCLFLYRLLTSWNPAGLKWVLLRRTNPFCVLTTCERAVTSSNTYP